MKLVISIDVEEEGLFCGQYARKPSGLKNVAHLRRIEFISKKFGLPLTLLATYPVACDPSCRDVLLSWRDDLRAEIGAHLHPWNTPPLEEMPFPEPVPSDLIPMPLLRAKLGNLTAAIQENLRVVPRAFRMGRFDFGEQIASLLPDHEFLVDSSIVPLRRAAGGPDHFLAPPDPHWLGYRAEPSTILEAPLTMVPVGKLSGQLIHRLAQTLPRRKADLLLAVFRYTTVLGIHPAWYPLASMKWAARLHRQRGGKVLNMFFHSSEIAPGATPKYRTEAAVQRLVKKIGTFLEWLARTGPVHGVTLSELYPAKVVTRK
ncbi:MAG: hypothetical protein WAN11_00270 [Syntrophobacteraceae bacterium]